MTILKQNGKHHGAHGLLAYGSSPHGHKHISPILLKGGGHPSRGNRGKIVHQAHHGHRVPSIGEQRNVGDVKTSHKTKSRKSDIKQHRERQHQKL